MIKNVILPVLLLVTLTACESACYNTMERFGVHKRAILVDRIAEAQSAQQEGQERFSDVLEQFRSVIDFEGAICNSSMIV